MTVIVGGAGRQKKLAETGGKLKGLDSGLGENFNLSDKQNLFLCQFVFIYYLFFVYAEDRPAKGCGGRL